MNGRLLAVLPLFAPALLLAETLPERALGVIEKRCQSCHGDKMSMSGLRLTSRESLLKGGDHGPAVKPGSAAESRLYQVVTHSIKPAMPPGPQLPAGELALLRDWIDSGADFPAVARTAPAKNADWWAFRKPVRPEVPRLDGVSNPIDAFIEARLRAGKLTAAPVADRFTLLRRASFDLHGLPPSPEMIKEFLADQSPEAWEKTIDKLLASPRYGEKWGRHWLDLVRYGDTSGFEQDPYNLEAFRYRDYVIKSFNDDKPYDRFVKEQLAGDELWPDSAEARTGTGYFRVGPNRDMLFKVEDLNRVEKLTDYVETTSGVLLGLTVGCARCHDHKFDPIPQRDFYRLQAIFAPATEDNVFLEYNTARFYNLLENNRKFKLHQLGETIERIQKPYRDAIRNRKLAPLPEEVRTAFATPDDKRTTAQQALVTMHAEAAKVTDDEIRTAMSENDREQLHSVEKRLVTMFANYGPPPTAPGIIDIGREAPRTYIAPRGNWQNPGEEVQPGFVTCLGGGDVPEPPQHATTTFRRKALAEWIARADHPTFGRVMVNRIWQFHFGQGLVRTPSDFGTRAGSPSHPELLDWLAAEFAARGWSMKQMHRLILTSQAYQRSANASPEAIARDPNNYLLSHMNRRRLASEELRDSVLAAAGTLNLKMGGVPVVPPLADDELYGIIGRPSDSWYVTANREEHTRRSVYLISRRTFRQPMFEAFDSPDGVSSCPRRESSTTATQSLTLLNGRFMMEQAAALAARAQSVDDAWLRVLGRAPSAEERSEAETFLDRQSARLGSKPQAFTELARALMNLNEFLYVD